RLGLVDPLLATRRALDQPARFDLERGGVEFAKFGRYAIDTGQAAVEVLEVGDHDFVPETEFLQVTHEVIVNDRELAGEIRFDVQVLESRFDARRYANDIGNCRSWGNCDAVRVAHAVFFDARTQRIPIERARFIDFNMAAAFVAQHRQRVLRQDA